VKIVEQAALVHRGFTKAGADEPGRAELRAILAALEREIARAQALRARARANRPRSGPLLLGSPQPPRRSQPMVRLLA
jgi:hypothetical protein